jgi:hypothetical protein
MSHWISSRRRSGPLDRNRGRRRNVWEENKSHPLDLGMWIAIRWIQVSSSYSKHWNSFGLRKSVGFSYSDEKEKRFSNSLGLEVDLDRPLLRTPIKRS